ncbi:uncharacterized protein LOC126631483 [Malus sylvestris]|uniref:uncharacterized protein LOC126631483 n=1 Tax=Malus sylvestris TaxID=3752 RepID=UPI0021AD49E1|nr:uncharacterized protein LOC126631483 [Malus sylvestris]
MNSIDIQCEAQAWLYEFKKWHGKHSCKKVSTPQKWRKLAAGWMKVNFDGAWDERHDQGGIGLVVRDVNGNFVVAMARHIGGIKSLTLAESLQRDSAANIGQFGHIFDDTRQLMENIPHRKVSFWNREANNVAYDRVDEIMSA